ncbi:MAG TPA: hypothetical protein VHP33_32990 [Polyangiaceae bacterium]|nr:hypothetical protein [Polyangiaceae bacterium]
MRHGKARSGWWVALGLAGCAGRAQPAVEQPTAAVVAAAPVAAPASSARAPDNHAEHVTAAPNTAQPAAAAALRVAAPYVPGPERRINWYGLSLDLSDVWTDETNYAFESPSEPIQQLVFEPSELQPAQVRPWLQEVRRRVDGAFGAKPSGVQPYENPSYFVLGVQIRFAKESLYDLFVTVDDRVVGITARCRSECDAALRGIVRSLKKHTAQGTGPAQKLKGAQHRYNARGFVFDSSMVFDTPNEFGLRHTDDLVEERIFCKRTSEPPADAELPPEIHWSYEATQAMAQLPRSEETLTGKSSDARAAVVRLYRREATASDGGRDNIPFSSNSAVVSIGSDVLHCYQLAGPTSPGLLARFHRLFESARYD